MGSNSRRPKASAPFFGDLSVDHRLRSSPRAGERSRRALDECKWVLLNQPRRFEHPAQCPTMGSWDAAEVKLGGTHGGRSVVRPRDGGKRSTGTLLPLLPPLRRLQLPPCSRIFDLLRRCPSDSAFVSGAPDTLQVVDFGVGAAPRIANSMFACLVSETRHRPFQCLLASADCSGVLDDLQHPFTSRAPRES